MSPREARFCPRCGTRIDDEAAATAAPATSPPDMRYDLRELAQLAARENAAHEGERARASQGDIGRLLEKRRRARP